MKLYIANAFQVGDELNPVFKARFQTKKEAVKFKKLIEDNELCFDIYVEVTLVTFPSPKKAAQCAINIIKDLD